MDPETWKSLYYGSFAGLPVYTSKWMPDTLIVMGNRLGKTQAMDLAYHPADETYRVGGRTYTAQVVAEMLMTRPYEKLNGSELSRILADQLQSGGPINPKPTAAYPPPGAIETTAFGDANRRSWLAGPVTNSLGQNVETTFRVGADGRPEAVTRLVDAPSKGAARNGGESELAWLKRRVDEICWRPT